jgi:hypothetical protein
MACVYVGWLLAGSELVHITQIHHGARSKKRQVCLYSPVCSCLNKLLSVQVGDHSAFCRSEASILFQLGRRERRINSCANAGEKITIIILSQFISTTNQSPLTFFFRSFLLIFHSLLTHSLSHPRFIYILSRSINHPPPFPRHISPAISVVLPGSVRQVTAFHWDDCVTDRGL